MCCAFAVPSLKRARGGRDARPCYIALASRLGLGIMPGLLVVTHHQEQTAALWVPYLQLR